MKVHYSSSLWSNEKGFRGGIQKTNWQFEYLGLKRYIPCIYHFREGIVFDLLTILDTNKMKAYLEKYTDIENKLTPIERQCAEQDHPFKEMHIRDIWIDDLKVEGNFSSSSSTNLPFMGENNELVPIQKAYHSILNGTDCFNCHRFCIPYPMADSSIKKLLRTLHLGRISTLKFITHEQRRFYPFDLHFTLSDKDSYRNISFIHPVTHITHNLYVELDDILEIPQNADRSQHFYTMSACYEIEPPLQQGDHLQFDSSISYTHRPTDNFSPTACASVGIIGGADGPTAISMDKSPTGPHGLPLHHCFSTITLEKSQEAHFIINGLDTKTGDSRIYELGK